MESKKQEIGKIEERNERILEIAKELGETIDLFQPTLDPSELPESVFEVNDSQITAARYAASYFYLSSFFSILIFVLTV